MIKRWEPKPFKRISKGEEVLSSHLRGVGIPFEREYKFHPTRKWSSDFAITEHKLLIEVEGGAYMIGRHQRPEGFANDCEKYNAATCLGWALLRYTTKMVEQGLAIAQIEQFINNRRLPCLS